MSLRLCISTFYLPPGVIADWDKGYSAIEEVKADEDLASSTGFANAVDPSQETDIIDHFPDDPAMLDDPAELAEFQKILPRIKSQLKQDLDAFRQAIDDANDHGGGAWIVRKKIGEQVIYISGGVSDDWLPSNYYDGVVDRLSETGILSAIGYHFG